jgi:hypothetical protein
MKLDAALESVESEWGKIPEVAKLLAFIRASTRGVIR